MTAMTFDDYCDAIRSADVSFILTHPESRSSALEIVGCGQVLLQFGTDGGGSIVEGVSQPDVHNAIMLVEPPDEVTFYDGQIVEMDSIVIMPAGSRWIFSSADARSWIAVSVPVALAEGLWGPIGGQARLVHVALNRHERLLATADACRVARRAGEMRQVSRELEREILDALQPAFEQSRIAVDGPEQERHQALPLVRRALEFLRQRPDFVGRTDDLAESIRTSERTLLRSFQKIVQMGPKRYLKCRQLNLARDALRQSHSRGRSVTEILSDVGVTEFGRFAGEYRALFGELPSGKLKGKISV
jgi:AraC family ethanolamine operon transcriptional activator